MITIWSGLFTLIHVKGRFVIMMIIDDGKCRGCGICMKNCPIGSILIHNRKASMKEDCSECGVCLKACPFHAIEKTPDIKEGAVVCGCCPIQCRITPGHTGACLRFTNENGTLKRNRSLVLNNPLVSCEDRAIERPIITGAGAGSTYPCLRPAPHIVSEKRDGVDVVTVVTEAPLSYSGVTVKIDTNAYIGEAGEPVLCEGRAVGMISTEEYGSKMLSIGGANRLTSPYGPLVARIIVSLANQETVTLRTENHTLELRAGSAPVIDGEKQEKMRFGCGSATVGIFARQMKETADDVIVIDHHIIGLLSEHLAGEEVGLTWSGVLISGTKSSRGRYFGTPGDGIMGTSIRLPSDVIKGADMTIARPGMTVFVTDTIGQTRSLYRLADDGTFQELPLTDRAAALADEIQDNCEESRVSVLYNGGTGGSARGGVTSKPLKLTQAVHAGKAKLTIGGAPADVYPGGGINFTVDTEKVVPGSFTWVPTPATVAPVEYTMRRDDYAAMGGHMDRIVDVDELKRHAFK